MTPAVPTHPQSLVYLGTPQMAVPPLRALAAAGFPIALVVTRPDKRRGRGGALSPSPVKAAALDLGLPVTHDIDDARAVGADLGVVVAYGRIIAADLLAQLPMINLHFSLLPRWRGAAPVERAILAGDQVTGVCVMAVDETLDTGAVYRRVTVPIGPEQTADELRAELVDAGASLLVESLQAGLGQPVDQEGEVTYAEKIAAEDLHLDWARPAVELDRVIRLGGAWTEFGARRCKVWRAVPAVEAPGEPPAEPGTIAALDPATGRLLVQCGTGLLAIDELQPEGKPRMAARSWANGAQPVGRRFGS